MIEDIYTKENGEAYHQAVHNFPEIAREWITHQRKSKIQKHISSTSNIFEFGSGLGFNIIGLESRSKKAYDIAEHLSNNYEGTSVQFSSDLSTFGNDTFDVVICHHVLEHVPNPTDILNIIKNKLTPDGTLLLYVPLETSSRYNKINAKDKDNHIYSWNIQTLYNLLRLSGFKITQHSQRRFGYDFISSRISHKLGLGEGGYRIIRAALNTLRPVYEIEMIARKDESVDE